MTNDGPPIVTITAVINPKLIDAYCQELKFDKVSLLQIALIHLQLILLLMEFSLPKVELHQQQKFQKRKLQLSG
ncbi:hypothetical protein T4E_1707 [Trichinella pseudospiralis]|uniref:Uncharacterized protein n=1 Tax=Trichinella pseudospiralis TaxID=6337 RepID=A0A0V0XQN6_TRIPS|nr:hypothetical protein T4E_1707 [Trichinella pseudospiralis]